MSPSSDGFDMNMDFLLSSESAFEPFSFKATSCPEVDKIDEQLLGISWTSHSQLNQVTLKKLTVELTDTYMHCNPEFTFSGDRVPRRVLSKNPNPAKNDGHDNSDDDYILYAKEILGEEAGKKYLVDEMLGQGTFGQVVSCICQTRNQRVAVKVIKNQPPYYNQALVEIDVLRKLVPVSDKGRFVKLLDTFTHRKHLCLVFELLGVSLLELIVQNQYRGLSLNLVRVITRQLLDSLIVLEENQIIHCDLKPENVLFENVAEAQIKVIDFGSSCYFGKAVYSYIQSRFYRSPEVLLGISYGASIDMWSLGCISAELFLGIPLFPGSSAYNMLARIIEMIGTPPQHMMLNGRFTKKYYHHFENYEFKFKSEQEYSKETGNPCPPSKKYFTAKSIPELIDSYPMKKSLAHDVLEKEKLQRRAFTDFLAGVLQIDPIVRWTPKVAREHPFITGKPFTEPFKPPIQEKYARPALARVLEMDHTTDHILKSPVANSKSLTKAQTQQSKPIAIHQGNTKPSRQPGFEIDLSLGTSPSTNYSLFQDGTAGSFKASSRPRPNQSNMGWSPSGYSQNFVLQPPGLGNIQPHGPEVATTSSILDTPTLDRPQAVRDHMHETAQPSVFSPSQLPQLLATFSLSAKETGSERDGQTAEEGPQAMQQGQPSSARTLSLRRNEYDSGAGYLEKSQHYTSWYHQAPGGVPYYGSAYEPNEVHPNDHTAPGYYGYGANNHSYAPPYHWLPWTPQMQQYMTYGAPPNSGYVPPYGGFPLHFPEYHPSNPGAQHAAQQGDSYQHPKNLSRDQPNDANPGSLHTRSEESSEQWQSTGPPSGKQAAVHRHSFSHGGRGRGGRRHQGDSHREAKAESSQTALSEIPPVTQKSGRQQHTPHQETATWRSSRPGDWGGVAGYDPTQQRPRAYSTGSQGKRGGWSSAPRGRGGGAHPSAPHQQQPPND